MNETATAAGTLVAPPHEDEMERSVLANIFNYPETIQIVSEILVPEHFYNAKYQDIYTAITACYNETGVTDLTSVLTRLTKAGKKDSVGGLQELVHISMNGAISGNVYLQAVAVYEAAMKRDALHMALQLIEDVKDSSKDIVDVLSGVEEQANGLTATASTNKCVMSIADCVDSNIKIIDENKSRLGGLAGITSGYRTIDERLNGFPRGAMVILAARPSVGKSALAVNMANKMADAGVKVAIFTYEMQPESIVSRMICSYTGLDYKKLRSGRLDDNEELLRLREETRLKGQRDKLFICRTDPSINSFRSTARQLKRKYDIDCIVLDYLQLLSAKGTNRQEEVSNISRSVKALALELDIPIIALSQLNRGVTGRTDKTPQLSDLRESGSIEQDADIVLMLHRPDYYGGVQQENGIGQSESSETQLIVAKQRDGALGPLPLTFHGKKFLFEEPSEESTWVTAREDKRKGWIEEHNVYANIPEPEPVPITAVPEEPPMPDLFSQSDNQLPF